MKLTARFILYALIAFVAASATYKYGFRPLGVDMPPPMKLNYQSNWLGIYAHIFGAVIALVLGPFQFSKRLRASRPRLHRWIGRIYLGVGVLIGGLGGLYMTYFAFGGAVVKIGFGLLAVLWLYTGYQGYAAIRAGNVQRHEAFMVRNFALTLAGVTFRLFLPSFMWAGFEFPVAYACAAWLCWVPNLIVAELVWNRSAKVPVRLVQPV